MIRRYRLGVAASLLLAVSLSIFFLWRQQEQSVTYVSDFNEIRTIVLPDSTLVTLNGHSSVTYRKDWTGQPSREIWLQGEAFVEVTHSKGSAGYTSFLVHLNDLQVQVLGTSFNVINRRGRQAVVLNTGKVLISAPQEKNELLSVKGEMVQHNDADNTISRRQVSADAVTSWRHYLLELDGIPAEELFNKLTDEYGYRIVLKDTSLLHKNISGELSLRDPDVMIKTLSVILDISIDKEGRTLTISRRH